MNFPHNNFHENNFYTKLHNDIIEYNQNLEKNLSLTRDIKNEVLNYLENKIKQILNFLNIEIKVYGSFVNDLSIESSDIDITIKYERKCKDTDIYNTNYIYEIDYIMSILTNSFNSIDCMVKINPIYTASVPIIKLVKN